MENVIIESQKEYDLRSKKNLETPNNKPSDKSVQNNANKPKIVKQKDKIVAGNSNKGKEKGTQNNVKQFADLSSTNTSVGTPVKFFFSNVNRTN